MDQTRQDFWPLTKYDLGFGAMDLGLAFYTPPLSCEGVFCYTVRVSVHLSALHFRSLIWVVFLAHLNSVQKELLYFPWYGISENISMGIHKC